MKLLLFCICFLTQILIANPTVTAIFGEERSPWSQQLKEEIWDHPAFQQVLQNERIIGQVRTAEHEVDLPVLILHSSKGEEIGRLGYLLISPEKYGELFVQMLQIEKICHHLKELNHDQLLMLYKKCRILNMQTCGANILKAGLAQDSGVDFLVEHYIALCKDHPRKARKIKQEIRARKPKNGHVEWLMALAHFEAHPQAKTLEKYLRRFGEHDAEYRFRCHLLLGEFYKEQNQMNLARHHLQEAMAQAPEELKSLMIPLEVQ